MDEIIAAMDPQKGAKLHGKSSPQSVQKLHTVLSDVTDDTEANENTNVVSFLRVSGGAS